MFKEDMVDLAYKTGMIKGRKEALSEIIMELEDISKYSELRMHLGNTIQNLRSERDAL